MSFEAQAEKTQDSGRRRVSFNIENLRQKPDKTAEEEKYLTEVDKARAEKQQLEQRAGERDGSQIKTVREQVARVHKPHETEHPVQFFKAADVEAAMTAKKEEEAKKQKGATRRALNRWAQFFRSSR